MPRYSIIVPVYNAGAYVGACLDSLLSQSGDFEVIAVNDGSTDDSGEILRRYADADSRVRLIEQPNSGVSAARNAALDAASGEWLLFADADDLYTPGALAVYDRLTADTSADMACASSVRFATEDDPEPFVSLPDGTWTPAVAHIRHYALWGHALRRDIVERHHMRFATDLAHSEDRVFLFEYSMYARAIATTGEVVYRYRISPTQATRCGDGVKIARHELRAARYIFDTAGRLAAEVSHDAHKALVNHGRQTVAVAIFHYYSRHHDSLTRRRLDEALAELPADYISHRQVRRMVWKTSLKFKIKKLLGR